MVYTRACLNIFFDNNILLMYLTLFSTYYRVVTKRLPFSFTPTARLWSCSSTRARSSRSKCTVRDILALREDLVVLPMRSLSIVSALLPNSSNFSKYLLDPEVLRHCYIWIVLFWQCENSNLSITPIMTHSVWDGACITICHHPSCSECSKFSPLKPLCLRPNTFMCWRQNKAPLHGATCCGFEEENSIVI